MSSRILSVLFAVVLASLAQAEDKPLIVHEWGTFTVLQHEDGTVLRGVNVNEEPLPRFTHRLFPNLVKNGHSPIPGSNRRSKGLPANFSSATMRMETPIIYIYPPNDEAIELDVRVGFKGGWISEWFPEAKVNAPGFDARHRNLGNLKRSSTGTIEWNNLTLNSNQSVPPTSHHVWLAPRNVQTPVLHTTNKEAEKYLFYRGVANIEAPLKIQQSDDKSTYNVVRNNSLGEWEQALAYSAMWLVDIPKPGVVAYRRIEQSFSANQNDPLASTPAKFSGNDYRVGNMERLRADMLHTLTADGLFEDEANAMLDTWELSYFKSPGTRLFFTLPRRWTDRVLPMELSQPATIERVMIGRIEVVTERQRQLLKLINSASISNPDWFWHRLPSFTEAEQAEIWRTLGDGSKQITDFDFDIPADYQAYLELGRFRESIVANAVRDEKAARIHQFARNYQIANR